MFFNGFYLLLFSLNEVRYEKYIKNSKRLIHYSIKHIKNTQYYISVIIILVFKTNYLEGMFGKS